MDSGLANISMLGVKGRLGGTGFVGLENLKSVSLPNITSVDMEAFSGCTNLICVTIPTSITEFYTFFSDCTSLRIVNYKGTEEQWNNITQWGYDEEFLSQLTINFNYTGV